MSCSLKSRGMFSLGLRLDCISAALKADCSAGEIMEQVILMAFICGEPFFTSKMNEEILSMDTPSCRINNLSGTSDQNVAYSHTVIISRGRLILYDAFLWDCVKFHLQVVYNKSILGKLCLWLVFKMCRYYLLHAVIPWRPVFRRAPNTSKLVSFSP